MTDGLIIDSFAGGGGASTGIEMALDRSPDYAIDHDSEALAMHAANHPATAHLTENIWKVDPAALTAGRKVALLWASPDCRHHSKAKGGKPVSRAVRGLADVVLVWARVARPEVIALENVEEFADWGPLLENDRPCPARKGMEFRRWVLALKGEGYAVDWRELRACDYGAPTIRKRLYLIARRDGEPIRWPAATHGDPKGEAVKAGRVKPWRTAAEIIDWNLPCPSIFLTRQEAKDEGLKVVRPLAAKTMSRIARGFRRYVLDRPEPFVVAVAHGDSGGRRSFGLDEPHRTVSTSGTEHALVAPILSYAQHGGASRPADAPHNTICANAKDQNQVVTPYLAVNRFDSTGRAADEPMSTITANSFIKRPGCGGPLSVVAQHLMTMRNSGKPHTGADEPSHTVTAGANHHAVVLPFIQSYYLQGGQDAPADEPMRTVPTKARFSPIAADLACPPFCESHAPRARQVAALLRAEGVWDGREADGSPAEFVTVGPYVVVDIGMRMLTSRELARAQGFPESYILAAPLPDGGTLTDTAQRHKIGNSVCPDVAAAILRANLGDPAAARPAEPMRQPRKPVPEQAGAQQHLFAAK